MFKRLLCITALLGCYFGSAFAYNDNTREVDPSFLASDITEVDEEIAKIFDTEKLMEDPLFRMYFASLSDEMREELFLFNEQFKLIMTQGYRSFNNLMEQHSPEFKRLIAPRASMGYNLTGAHGRDLCNGNY